MSIFWRCRSLQYNILTHFQKFLLKIDNILHATTKWIKLYGTTHASKLSPEPFIIRNCPSSPTFWHRSAALLEIPNSISFSWKLFMLLESVFSSPLFFWMVVFKGYKRRSMRKSQVYRGLKYHIGLTIMRWLTFSLIRLFKIWFFMQNGEGHS